MHEVDNLQINVIGKNKTLTRQGQAQRMISSGFDIRVACETATQEAKFFSF